MVKPTFSLGQIVATPGAFEALLRAGINPLTLLARHAAGDWGTVSPGDARENDLAVREGFRVFSAYPLAPPEPEPVVWIITEADRSVTTLLLPEDY